MDSNPQPELRALGERVARYVGILNDLPVLVCRNLPDGTLEFVNAAYAAYFGKTVQDLVGRSFLELVPAAERSEILQRLRTLTPAAPLLTHVHHAIAADGSVRIHRWTNRALFNDRGELLELQAFGEDVTEQVHMEQSLKEREAALRAIQDNLPYLSWLKDGAGRFLAVNRVFAAACGAPDAQAVVGKTDLDVWPRELAERYRADDEEVMSSRKQKLVEEPIAQPEGEPRWFETYKTPVLDDRGEVIGTAGFARDITDRKHAEAMRQAFEAQLRQAQKLEALGTLAGGIAHDFNNLLSTILGNAQLARLDLSGGHPALTSVDEILHACRRARELVQRILTYSSPHAEQLQPLALPPLLQEAAQLLRATLPAGVELQVECDDALPAVRADGAQVQQAIINLATNAWHALEHHAGVVQIRAQRVAVGDGAAQTTPRIEAGEYVRISVKDNGCGMTQDVLTRIFDPFFTTKPTGQGTGLGLAVVHGVMRSHRGGVGVTSAPGAGSTFDLFFPVSQESACLVEQHAAPASRAGAGERILYVEDDPPLASLAERSLGRLGYRVTVHTSPAAALAEFASAPDRFAAVVTDYNMPGMSGLDLVRAVRTIKADAIVVLSSGYLGEEEIDQAQSAGVAHVLLKPSSAADLAAVLQRLLRHTKG